MMRLMNPECMQGDPGDPPEYASTNPMRCPNCKEIVDGDEGCPDCELCEGRGCQNFAHTCSENGLCAACEVEGLQEDIKEEWTLPLAVELEIWKAHLAQEAE
jgi:hypothetical protein